MGAGVLSCEELSNARKTVLSKTVFSEPGVAQCCTLLHIVCTLFIHCRVRWTNKTLFLNIVVVGFVIVLLSLSLLFVVVVVIVVVLCVCVCVCGAQLAGIFLQGFCRGSRPVIGGANFK